MFTRCRRAPSVCSSLSLMCSQFFFLLRIFVQMIYVYKHIRGKRFVEFAQQIGTWTGILKGLLTRNKQSEQQQKLITNFSGTRNVVNFGVIFRCFFFLLFVVILLSGSFHLEHSKTLRMKMSVGKSHNWLKGFPFPKWIHYSLFFLPCFHIHLVTWIFRM